MQKAALINHGDMVSPTIFRLIGGKLLVTGFIDKAKVFFTKALELDSDSAFYFSCLGGTESDQGNYEKSVEYFEKAYRSRANYTEVMRRLGENYSIIPVQRISKILVFNLIGPDPGCIAFWQNGLERKLKSISEAENGAEYFRLIACLRLCGHIMNWHAYIPGNKEIH
jgi:tetratricopeptide (TPR) repeat protein